MRRGILSLPVAAFLALSVANPALAQVAERTTVTPFATVGELITGQKVRILGEFSEHKDDVETRFRENFEIEGLEVEVEVEFEDESEDESV